MHLKDQHPFYPCSEEEKLEIRKELGMKESILQEDIDALTEWFYKQPHLAHASLDPDHIEKLLIATKGSREKAKLRIENFYKHRSLAPEILHSRSKIFNNPDYDPWTFYRLKVNDLEANNVSIPLNFRRCCMVQSASVLWLRGRLIAQLSISYNTRQTALLKLYKGKRISIFKITDSNPNNFDINVMLTNTLMLGDLRLKFDYMLGDIWIIDLQNSSFGHVLRINPTLMQKFTNIIQDGIGFKLFEVHIINAPTFGHHVINFVKQFAKPKIMDRFICHDKFDDLQKFIPKSYLPADYGGDQPSLDDFKDMYRKELLKDFSKKYLLDSCHLISDERKRVGTKFQDEYLVGSFKKLDLD